MLPIIITSLPVARFILDLPNKETCSLSTLNFEVSSSIFGRTADQPMTIPLKTVADATVARFTTCRITAF